MKAIFALMTGSALCTLPLPALARQPVTMSYFLPRTLVSVEVAQRLDACPDADSPNGSITTTVTIEPSLDADPDGLVQIDGSAGFLAKRTTKLVLRANGTLESFNATTEGEGGAVIASLLKVGTTALSFLRAGGPAQGALRAPLGQSLKCNADVLSVMAQIATAKKSVSQIEDALVEGRAGEAALDLLERRRKRVTALRDSLTIVTTSQGEFSPSVGTIVLEAPNYGAWFHPNGDQAEVRGSGIAGRHGFLVTVTKDQPMLDKLRGDGTALPTVAVPYLIFRRPVPASVKVQPCISPPSKGVCTPDNSADGIAASGQSSILVAQASGLYKLPIGRGGMFGSKEASAEFDEWGAPISLQYGSASSAADIASTIDAAGEAATTLRDARVERIKRKIDLIEAQNKLDELQDPKIDD